MTDQSWDSRWRSESHYHGHNFDRKHAPYAHTPSIGHQSHPVQNTLHSAGSYFDSREVKSRGEPEQPPSISDRSADAYHYHTRLHGRHTSPGRNHSLANSPDPRQKMTENWQSLPVDHRPSNRNTSEAPLSLHIPQSQDLPKPSNAYPPSSMREQQPSYQPPTTSLPSFASLSEQASRTDDPDEVEIAPMSARLPCHSCSKLTPMIRDVALAVADLDESVQQYCSKNMTRSLDCSKDNPIRAAQWILETLVKTKADLQETARRMQSNYFPAPTPMSSLAPPPLINSPSSGLKRPADRWDQDDFPAPKRPRSGASFHELHRTTSNAGPRGDRRASIDFISRSPPPTESIPGSAYPRTGSPGFSARPHRTLPSPSSLAYGPSAAPSIAAPTAASVGSPGTNDQSAMSIHTASASSATSAHIADLQHQVTLKSLALQTLQSEYASLLQKLQRERVKSQTIEKKTTVADQEVNDLTSKNEDLAEQIKSLETQLEDCEKKRELERSTAASEKEQWTRILQMHDRLQAKSADDKQKLRDENSALSQRVAAYEGDSASRFDHVKRSDPSRTDASRMDSDGQIGGEAAGRSFAEASNDVEGLRGEVAVLNNRIEVLRFALVEAKRKGQQLGEKAREVSEQHADIGTNIDRALESDSKTTAHSDPLEKSSNTSNRSTPAQAKPVKSPDVPSGNANPSTATTTSSNLQQWPQTGQTTSLGPSIASIGRAVSPGPAELGFHVTPSTSSPEELISALGPLPAPLPPLQFDPMNSLPDSSKRSTAPKRKPRKPASSPLAGNTSAENTQMASFRPLTNVPAHQPFHSSPISVAESVSPNSSSGEESARSEQSRSVPRALMSGRSAFAVGLPAAGEVADTAAAYRMAPPPPRPSMNLRDLCSAPAGQWP